MSFFLYATYSYATSSYACSGGNETVLSHISLSLAAHGFGGGEPHTLLDSRLPLAGKTRQEPHPGSNHGLNRARREKGDSATRKSSSTQGALVAFRRNNGAVFLDCVFTCMNRRGLLRRKSGQVLLLVAGMAAATKHPICHESACKSRQGLFTPIRHEASSWKRG